SCSSSSPKTNFTRFWLALLAGGRSTLACEKLWECYGIRLAKELRTGRRNARCWCTWNVVDGKFKPWR
ncbi:hypothetical protein, partial [Mycetohabitans sp. B4]|uniref:hypothetical protein n=1 Tax=Mycetohabitans sp. B4 TaxID=2841842 RepID=UPI001F3F39AB